MGLREAGAVLDAGAQMESERIPEIARGLAEFPIRMPRNAASAAVRLC